MALSSQTKIFAGVTFPAYVLLSAVDQFSLLLGAATETKNPSLFCFKDVARSFLRDLAVTR